MTGAGEKYKKKKKKKKKFSGTPLLQRGFYEDLISKRKCSHLDNFKLRDQDSFLYNMYFLKYKIWYSGEAKIENRAMITTLHNKF